MENEIWKQFVQLFLKVEEQIIERKKNEEPLLKSNTSCQSMPPNEIITNTLSGWCIYRYTTSSEMSRACFYQCEYNQARMISIANV